ncbi:hypothetical protein [Roseibium salinum]|uniref:DUF4864 domain-containing protein n=1 Tax=Roseibium salinum TaxID=1604349 RepID=A0ABT3QWZ0_9HYPH|nr:hypothetical protein [Roseibium sp. DSM 29163]MCX2721455.1 hypothetical protein [Roseibium sp. DSM 29163]MDN3721929.1 hypothetical protein [Roseibium salinum]
MKTWLKVLLGIAAAIVLAIAAVFYLTSGVTRAGDDLFAAIADGDMDKAYGTLSTAFRANTSESEFSEYIAASRMDKVSETSWSSRSMNGGSGNLVGTLTTVEGESIPVELDLIKEDGEWKIYAIRKTAGEAGVGHETAGIPDEAEQVTLVIGSMNTFADAVAAQDMTVFHEHISRLWAGNIDAAELEEVFKPFYRIGADLQVIKTMSPVFDSPGMLSEEGTMKIKGHYPTSPNFHFALNYKYEGTQWKVWGLSVELEDRADEE